MSESLRKRIREINKAEVGALEPAYRKDRREESTNRLVRNIAALASLSIFGLFNGAGLVKPFSSEHNAWAMDWVASVAIAYAGASEIIRRRSKKKAGLKAQRIVGYVLESRLKVPKSIKQDAFEIPSQYLVGSMDDDRLYKAFGLK